MSPATNVTTGRQTSVGRGPGGFRMNELVEQVNTEVQTYEDRPFSDFNPNEHLIQIPSKDGKKDYLPVQWRLVWFRLMCPQGTIDTEELEVDNDRECEAEVSVWNQETRRSEKVLKVAKGYARYKAVVTDGKGGRASATKTERKVDFDDFVEKAETGAVGRALAMLGYGTQFAMLEFDEGERVVDAPVERKPAKPYQERRTFVEADKDVKSDGKALHALAAKGSYEKHEANGHQEPEQAPLTLNDVKWRARDTGIAKTGKDWQMWVAQTLGVFVPDEKLKDEQPRLVQLNDEITKKVSAGVGK